MKPHRWYRHQWERWQDVTVHVLGDFDNWDETRQERTCAACGRTQIRKIRRWAL